MTHRLASRRRIVTARNITQAAFALFLAYSGWRFYLFVQHFATGGASPFVSRPASVDAFLPLSALVALKAWLGTGILDRTHPAALVFLLTILGTSLLFKRGFCSWICPVGTLEEALARLGRRLAGRNFFVPSIIDWLLRTLKYLGMALFLLFVFAGMSSQEALAFLNTDYNRVADVMMLYFFTHMGQTTAVVLIALAALSIPFANFWCRYLCPYGALLGLLAIASPVRLSRNAGQCTSCMKCNRACPNRLEVARLNHVSSPECTGCLDCLAACHQYGAIELRLPLVRRAVSPWLFPVLVAGSFLLALAVAQVAGYWLGDVTSTDYAGLIPAAGLAGR